MVIYIMNYLFYMFYAALFCDYALYGYALLGSTRVFAVAKPKTIRPSGQAPVVYSVFLNTGDFHSSVWGITKS